MPYKATQGFSTSVDGRKVIYGRGDEVPAEVARRLPGCVDSDVEQATAAPGEVRNVTIPDSGNVCDCGFEAKTAGGLATHRRACESG